MVAARDQFLGRGFFDPVVNAAAGLAAEGSDEPELIAELGSGTGHYLEAITTAVSPRPPRCAVGMDLSTAAARSASRRVPGALFVVADLQEGIPLRSGSADLVASVFAPRPLGELARVTRPGGLLVLAFAAPDHLVEIRESCSLINIHPRKLEEIQAGLRDVFVPCDTRHVEYALDLEPGDLELLIGMGPSARHRTPERLVEGRRTRVSVVVASFRRLPAKRRVSGG
jgi:23S rRNA (guanine745-N1)-methyltransferase